MNVQQKAINFCGGGAREKFFRGRELSARKSVCVQKIARRFEHAGIVVHDAHDVSLYPPGGDDFQDLPPESCRTLHPYDRRSRVASALTGRIKAYSHTIRRQSVEYPTKASNPPVQKRIRPTLHPFCGYRTRV